MENVTKNLRDAAYVAVGIGVIGFQQLEARAEALRTQFSSQRVELDKQVTERRERAQAQFAKLAKELEERFEPVQKSIETGVDNLQELLPERAKELLTQARAAALEAQTNLRSRLNGAAA
jgi:hypothetical protein